MHAHDGYHLCILPLASPFYVYVVHSQPFSQLVEPRAYGEEGMHM